MEMPNLGLSTSEIDFIIAYLGSGGAGSATPEAAPALQGNAEAGKDLFTGVARFANGGPPCMACHSTGGIGALGGGQLGPDLTDVAKRLGGPTDLSAWIAGLPTPTMKAVWTKQPPTPQERANVVAFLDQTALAVRTTGAIWQLMGLTGLGAVILLLIAGVWWRNRLKFGMRRPMMATPTTGRSYRSVSWWLVYRYRMPTAGSAGLRIRVTTGQKLRGRTNAPRRHS